MENREGTTGTTAGKSSGGGSGRGGRRVVISEEVMVAIEASERPYKQQQQHQQPYQHPVPSQQLQRQQSSTNRVVQFDARILPTDLEEKKMSPSSSRASSRPSSPPPQGHITFEGINPIAGLADHRDRDDMSRASRSSSRPSSPPPNNGHITFEGINPIVADDTGSRTSRSSSVATSGSGRRPASPPPCPLVKFDSEPTEAELELLNIDPNCRGNSGRSRTNSPPPDHVTFVGSNPIITVSNHERRNNPPPSPPPTLNVKFDSEPTTVEKAPQPKSKSKPKHHQRRTSSPPPDHHIHFEKPLLPLSPSSSAASVSFLDDSSSTSIEKDDAEEGGIIATAGGTPHPKRGRRHSRGYRGRNCSRGSFLETTNATKTTVGTTTGGTKSVDTSIGTSTSRQREHSPAPDHVTFEGNPYNFFHHDANHERTTSNQPPPSPPPAVIVKFDTEPSPRELLDIAASWHGTTTSKRVSGVSGDDDKSGEGDATTDTGTNDCGYEQRQRRRSSSMGGTRTRSPPPNEHVYFAPRVLHCETHPNACTPHERTQNPRSSPPPPPSRTHG